MKNIYFPLVEANIRLSSYNILNNSHSPKADKNFEQL